jgi:hypothetical protein
VAEDPTAEAGDRATAAVALAGTLDEGERGRLRVAAGAVAAPEVRAVLETLQGPVGPSIGGVVPEGGGLALVGAAAVAEIQRRLCASASGRVVLLGPRGSGKSIAAAALYEALGAGEELARWTRTIDLVDAEDRTVPAALDRALRSRVLVLDEVGYELAGAPPRSDRAGRRGAAVLQILAELMDNPHGRRLIATTGLDADRIDESYGSGAARRLYEGAEVIHFVRPSPPATPLRPRFSRVAGIDALKLQRDLDCKGIALVDARTQPAQSTSAGSGV